MKRNFADSHPSCTVVGSIDLRRREKLLTWANLARPTSVGIIHVVLPWHCNSVCTRVYALFMVCRQSISNTTRRSRQPLKASHVHQLSCSLPLEDAIVTPWLRLRPALSCQHCLGTQDTKSRYAEATSPAARSFTKQKA
jgi:hypothetical protein